ncbi:hypothetical protein GALMADRAFT_1083985 [Galerina marginata CBS 339.88]|uniref:Uncharacterized protein n=1 Tax=Galerina marginata (strain CBS 339.88) TaxID=685588 RepID=A0A067SI10_GALM3|nr:hypothetical protein GALMADRAFT_1083985 [Galerina marginata CBS 339.88]
MFVTWQPAQDKNEKVPRERSTSHSVKMMYLRKVKRYRGRDADKGKETNAAEGCPVTGVRPTKGRLDEAQQRVKQSKKGVRYVR